MSDSEESDGDLFADFEKADCESVNVSANLVHDVGEENVIKKVRFRLLQFWAFCSLNLCLRLPCYLHSLVISILNFRVCFSYSP